MQSLAERFTELLQAHDDLHPLLAHHLRIPPQEAEPGDLGEPLPSALEAVLRALGIHQLYRHQTEAIDLIRRGRDTVIATSAASGKTLVYLIPVFEAMLRGEQPRAIFLYPYKALSRDQLANIQRLGKCLGFSPAEISAAYDGDTPSNERNLLKKKPPHILITNPDMLHLGILPYHTAWRTFFSQIRYVVLDEMHTYRGVFGSHVSHILRRLLRLIRAYGGNPRVIGSSATIANPRELFHLLTGRDAEVVTHDGSPSEARHLLIVNPADGLLNTAYAFFRLSVRFGLKTIAFTKSRHFTELMYSWARERDPEMAARISGYRAGFLPEERRAIEKRLFEGDLVGVISTSALETGINVGGLDCCLLVGYPGTITSLRQREGRVGRRLQEALVILVAGNDALDQYFVKNPQELFTRDLEEANLDPGNAYILAPHLQCAAVERPIHEDEVAVFGTGAQSVVDQMISDGRLLPAPGRALLYSADPSPHRQFSIRSAGSTYAVITTANGHTIGSVSGPRAFHELHTGALYLHHGEKYEVLRLDLEQKRALVRRADVDYYTQTRGDKDTEILEILTREQAGPYTLGTGRLRITETIHGYVRKRIFEGDIIGRYDLELPPTMFETTGLWIEIPEPVRDAINAADLHFMGSIHALEHAAMALIPLFMLGDMFDMSGISFPNHPQLQRAAVFLYDHFPGGLGIALRLQKRIDPLLQKVFTAISQCPCEQGCPSCIYSPRCGAGNHPLDKKGVLMLLEFLLGKRKMEEAPPSAPHKPPEPIVTSKPESEPADGTELPAPAETSSHPQTDPPYRALVFDLETLRSAEDVGGWRNVRKMGLGIGVTYDIMKDQYTVYRESDALRLIEDLASTDLVNGFNTQRFDYLVLDGYRKTNWKHVPSLDILVEVEKRLRHRLSLGHLARYTLGESKSADGLQSLQWVREGRWDDIIDYCKQDVFVTWRIFDYGLRRGHLLYKSRWGGTTKVEVDWHEYWPHLAGLEP